MTKEGFCPSCEEYRATKVVERKERYTVRGQQIEVPVRSEVCTECGQSLGSDEQDKEVLDAVHAEYRRQADLLTPERIKEIRKRYRLSQKSFAALLGMSEATINRYEQGGLQDPAHDTVIRACERPEVVRGLLARRGDVLSGWQQKRAKDALAGQVDSDLDWAELFGDEDCGRLAAEVSARTGFRRFDYDRYASVAAWFCERLGQVSRTVINKLLFYTDFLNFKTATVSMTGAAYRAAPYGPVPADYGVLLDRLEADGVLVCREVEFPNGNTGYYYQSGPNADSVEAEFTAHEERVLEHVATQLDGMSAKAISERSHQESAYCTTELGQVISYEEAAGLSLSLPD